MIAPPAPPYLVHLWAWDQRAARIPPSGRAVRITFGSWACLLCRMHRAWAMKYDRRELPGDCPGAIGHNPANPIPGKQSHAIM